MVRNLYTIAVEVVVPVHTEQVAWIGGVFINTFCDVL